jgi:ABC-2 type transport system ATP-binding protein
VIGFTFYSICLAACFPLHSLAVIVRCENLDQSYGKVRALSGVSCTVESGCTGLLGPNGAGKSTLIKSLLGQLSVPAGRLQVVGQDPAVVPLKVRQLVGYMPETDVYLPGSTGLELTAFCGQLSGMKRSDAVSRAHEVLHFVGVGEARYREVDGYSTGMRQRVKLGCALVHGPKLLLLDEPTTGLDPAGREEMLQLVDDVAHNRGIDVVLSSHILRDIEKTCDRLVVLHEGRVVFSGSREDFQHQEARVLHVRVKTDRDKMAESLAAAGCEVNAREGMAYLEVVLPEGKAPDLVWGVALSQGLQIRHLAPATVSMEQAFEKAVRNEAGGETP